MTRRLVCFVLLTALASGENAGVQGRAVDASQAPLPRALARLIPMGDCFAAFRSVADLNGQFEIKDVPPGKYTLRIGLNAFRERTLPELELSSGELKNLGAIRLEFAGCDAPEVICDSIVARNQKPEPSTIVSQGYITMRRNGSADLDSGRVFQSDESDRSESGRGSDVLLMRASGSWQLVPADGASLSQTDCDWPQFEATPIRLDGMGPGVEICVQTDLHYRSGVFIVDEIRPESATIRLWHVTRK